MPPKASPPAETALETSIDADTRRFRDALCEAGPQGKWEGAKVPGPYWSGCDARQQRKRGVDREDAQCRFPNCDELGCLRHLSEPERTELKRIDAERKAEAKRYKEAWMRKAGLVDEDEGPPSPSSH